MAKHIIATVDEIPPGGRKLVEIGGRSIGVFNIDGDFFALRNSCPHQGGALCKGRLTGFLQSDAPGDFRYTRRGEILRCPWHGWEFDVKTGQSWFDPTKTRVRSYEVSVERGSLVDSTAVAVQGDGESELQKGPYQAETFPVTVEQAYIVIEI